MHNTRPVFGSLKNRGWITLINGSRRSPPRCRCWALEGFGRYFGIGVGVVAALGALLEIPAYPFWSLSVLALDILALDILALHGLVAYGSRIQRELKRHSNRLKTQPVFFCPAAGRAA